MESLFDSCYDVDENQGVVTHINGTNRSILFFEYLGLYNQHTVVAWEFHASHDVIATDVLGYLETSTSGLPAVISTWTFAASCAAEIYSTLQLPQVVVSTTCWQLSHDAIVKTSIPQLQAEQASPPSILIAKTPAPNATGVTPRAWVKAHLERVGITTVGFAERDDPALMPAIKLPHLSVNLQYSAANIALIDAILASSLPDMRRALAQGAHVNRPIPSYKTLHVLRIPRRFNHDITCLTPLMLATYLGQEETVRVLHGEFNADIHQVIRKRGQAFTAMDFALLKDSPSLSIFFLTQGVESKLGLAQIRALQTAKNTIEARGLEAIKMRLLETTTAYSGSVKSFSTKDSYKWSELIKLCQEGHHGDKGNTHAQQLATALGEQQTIPGVLLVLQKFFYDPQGNWFDPSLKPAILATFLDLSALSLDNVGQNDQAASRAMFKLRCLFLSPVNSFSASMSL